MNATKTQPQNLDTAIEEAIEFGFTRQLLWINGAIKKLFSPRNFLKEEFAIVKTHMVSSGKRSKSIISYIVLNDGTLGYVITSKKTQPRRKLTRR